MDEMANKKLSPDEEKSAMKAATEDAKEARKSYDNKMEKIKAAKADKGNKELKATAIEAIKKDREVRRKSIKSILRTALGRKAIGKISAAKETHKAALEAVRAYKKKSTADKSFKDSA